MTESYAEYTETQPMRCARIVVEVGEDWMTRIYLPDEDEPVTLMPGDVMTIEPRQEVTVHRQMPPHART
jgi:hypothetical protein